MGALRRLGKQRTPPKRGWRGGLPSAYSDHPGDGGVVGGSRFALIRTMSHAPRQGCDGHHILCDCRLCGRGRRLERRLGPLAGSACLSILRNIDLRSRGVVLSSRSKMLKSPLLGICVAVAALLSTGAQPAAARDGPGSDFSPITEWKNQIGSDLEHNKRHLPDSRTRGKIGTVRFELTMNRAGWVLPGTRIVTVDPGLGRVAPLLL